MINLRERAATGN